MGSYKVEVGRRNAQTSGWIKFLTDGSILRIEYKVSMLFRDFCYGLQLLEKKRIYTCIHNKLFSSQQSAKVLTPWQPADN